MGGGTLRGGGGIVEGNEGSAAAASGGEVAPPRAVLDVWPEELLWAVTQGGLAWTTPGGQTAQGWGGRGWGGGRRMRGERGQGRLDMASLSRSNTREKQSSTDTRPRPPTPAWQSRPPRRWRTWPCSCPLRSPDFDFRHKDRRPIHASNATSLRPTDVSLKTRVGMESARVRPRWSVSGTC